MSSLADFRIDASRFPVVEIEVLRLPDDAQLTCFLDELEALAAKHDAPLVFVLDARNGIRLPKPQSQQILEACRSGSLGRHLKGEAVLVRSALLMRLGRLLLWLRPPPIRMSAFTQREPARRWARALVE